MEFTQRKFDAFPGTNSYQIQSPGTNSYQIQKPTFELLTSGFP